MQKRKATLLFAILLVSLLTFLPTQFIPAANAASPSLVGTSTSWLAVSYPNQRKSFYAAGRFWAFWSDGTNMVYSTSTDGSTWTSPTTVRACTQGYYFSIWFDGTYLHYAYASSSPIYYRRGTPNSDGTITWSADEQTLSTTYNKAQHPTVSVDSNGYVWVGYQDNDGTNYYPYVIKSQYNNGTFGTGTITQFSSSPSYTWRVSAIPLTGGKMLVVYARSSNAVYAKRWDGSAWGTQVATTSAIDTGYVYSAVAQGDDVHLTFLKYSTYDIIYTKYNYSSNSFSTETTLIADATYTSAPTISIDPSTNDLYVFAATKTTGTPSGWTANHIYYKKYTASSGTWGSWTDWIDESTEVLTDSDRLTCFYKAYGNYIGLVYQTKMGPYNVKFGFFGLRNLNIRTKDANGNILNNATVYTAISSKTVNDFGWANFTGIGDTSVKVEYQGLLVNSPFTLTMDNDVTTDVTCNVTLYSLTVKVQTASGAPISGCPLELWRDTTLLNGLYGLPSSPKTDSNGMFTWQRLANQSSSYTIKTPWTGIPWVTTNLTKDTLITMTAAPAPAPPPTPTPTPTPTPSPPWAPVQLPSPEQIKEAFMQFPILIIIPMSLVIVAYALIARRKS